MKIEHLLFTEKYRPQTLDELVVPEYLKKIFEHGVVQNTLFYGSPGSGKTSAAKVLVKQFDHPYLYINASKETGVDVIRNRITNFCSTMPLSGDISKLKVVILDEIDGASQQFFKAFKASMEEFHERARFIATSNYINKIEDGIISRFDGGSINFDFPKEFENELMKGYIKRLYEITKKEEINIEKDALVELVKRKFPDFRSILNTFQSYKISGKEIITVDDVRRFNSIFKDVFELVFNNIKPEKNYQYMVSNYSNRVDDVLSSFGNEFIEYIKMEKPEFQPKIPQIIIAVTKYQAMREQVIDPILPMLALIYELQDIVHKK